MSFLQLLTTTRTIPVETDQILQETFIVNTSEAWLLFEDHCQLWNLDSWSRIHKGPTIPGTFFYTLPASVDRTSIAVVRLENCDPQLEIFNIETGEVKTLAGFPNEQENFTKLMYFEDTGSIVVASKGKQTRLYTWDPAKNKEYAKELPFTKYDENAVFEKYNSNNTIVSFSGTANSNTFQLIKNGAPSTYNLGAGIEQGTIKVVKEYSNTEAIVALTHGEKTSTIILFNLSTGTNLKVTSFPFPIDMVLKVSDNWIGIATVGDDEESNLKVKACFRDEQQFKIDLPRGLRIWNDYMPIMLVSYEHKDTDEKKQQTITTVKCAPKRSIYINFLEKLGIVDTFGAEIIKEVVNNFN